MSYVVGTYYDKMGEMNCLLSADDQPTSRAIQSIDWQIGSHGTMDRFCHWARGEHDNRTAWHICEPTNEPLVMRCNSCGETLRLDRGGFTWEAFHSHARKIWPSVDCSVAVFRLERNNA